MTKTQNDPLKPNSLPRKAGTVLEPLFTWHGMDIYPVFGASQPTGEPDGEPDEDEEDETGEGGNDGGSAKEETVSRADFLALQRQLSAADKKRNEAEARLKELDDAQKDELTRATEKVTELEKQREADARTIADLQLQNAFLTAETDLEWHDPGDALALAERKGYLDGVVVEGKVDGRVLATKLKEMAKAHSYLVKSSTDQDDKPPVRTGAPVGGKTKQRKADEPDLGRYGRFLNK